MRCHFGKRVRIGMLGNMSGATECPSFQGNQMSLNMDIVNRGAFHTFLH